MHWSTCNLSTCHRGRVLCSRSVYGSTSRMTPRQRHLKTDSWRYWFTWMRWSGDGQRGYMEQQCAQWTGKKILFEFQKDHFRTNKFVLLLSTHPFSLTTTSSFLMAHRWPILLNELPPHCPHKFMNKNNSNRKFTKSLWESCCFVVVVVVHIMCVFICEVMVLETVVQKLVVLCPMYRSFVVAVVATSYQLNSTITSRFNSRKHTVQP